MGGARSTRTVIAGSAGLLLVLGATGCGQDRELAAVGKAAASAVRTSGAASCTPPTSTTKLPDTWPALPLVPEDYALASVETRSGDRTVVAGVVPHAFRDALTSLRTAYEQAGLVLDHGEVEERDAESNFHGKGYEGRWALREVPGCPSSTTLSLVVTKAG